jgi:hypothetical protein
MVNKGNYLAQADLDFCFKDHDSGGSKSSGSAKNLMALTGTPVSNN